MKALRFPNAAPAAALAKIPPESEQVAKLLVDRLREEPGDLPPGWRNWDAALASATNRLEIEKAFIDGSRGGWCAMLAFALAEMKTNRLEIENALLDTHRRWKDQVLSAPVVSPNWITGETLSAWDLKRLGPQTPEGRALVRRVFPGPSTLSPRRELPPERGVQDLINDIKYDSRRSADSAFSALKAASTRGDTNVAKAVPTLIEYASNPGSARRLSAIDVLGSIGPAASNAVPCLMACLGDDDRFVHESSLAALGRIGPSAKPAIPAIRALLTNEPSRFPAANVLWRVDSQYVPLAVSVFVEILNQRSLRGDILAVAVDEMGPPAKPVLPALARLLNDDDPHIRLLAAKALWHVDPGQVSQAVPALGKLANEFSSCRLEAIKLLGEIGPAARAALPRLRACLKDEDDEVAVAATWAVWKISGEEAGTGALESIAPDTIVRPPDPPAASPSPGNPPTSTNPAARPLFQIRLVERSPSDDSEPMKLVQSFQGRKLVQRLNVQKTVLVDQTALHWVRAGSDGPGRGALELTLNERGRRGVAEVSRRYLGRRFAIIIDGSVRMAPVIQTVYVDGQMEITGGLTEDEAREIARKFVESRRLP